MGTRGGRRGETLANPAKRERANSLSDNDKDDEATPTGKRSKVRHSLETLAGIIGEASKVYREMRDDKLDHNKGRSLIWALSQMRAMVETQALERLEERLEELTPATESRAHGLTRANRTARTAH